MLSLILSIAGSLVIAPLLVIATRQLYTVFLREGASLFVGLDMHKEWAQTLAATMSLVNVVIFCAAWWAAVTLNYFEMSAFITVAPILAALALTLYLDYAAVRDKLKLHFGDAAMVGVLAFTGGNLPLILTMPVLLWIVLHARSVPM